MTSRGFEVKVWGSVFVLFCFVCLFFANRVGELFVKLLTTLEVISPLYCISMLPVCIYTTI